MNQEGIDFTRDELVEALGAAKAEIERLKKTNEHWHKVVSFNKTDMDAMIAKVEKLSGEITQYVKIFKHYHESNHVNDNCWKCGLYLADQIHLRMDERLPPQWYDPTKLADTEAK